MVFAAIAMEQLVILVRKKILPKSKVTHSVQISMNLMTLLKAPALQTFIKSINDLSR